MADILRWLIDSFSNSSNTNSLAGKMLIDSRELPIELDTETDRVMFVKAAAQLLASRLNIKIHTKRRYQSDVMCISELSKLSSVQNVGPVGCVLSCYTHARARALLSLIHI